jgi:hypothetical protein
MRENRIAPVSEEQATMQTDTNPFSVHKRGGANNSGGDERVDISSFWS